MVKEAIEISWLVIQILIGFHLFFPIALFCFSKIGGQAKPRANLGLANLDYAIILTAYQETFQLQNAVASILNQSYQHFIVYLVADDCDISSLIFDDERIIVLRPERVIGSNTGSHQYAVEHFIRNHDIITIMDSDNILDKSYLSVLNLDFNYGFKAVQGVREAKNLDTNYACLDAARDIYYHFFDGEVLFKSGSSATLAGSGMAFRSDLYASFLTQNKVSGAGFDKVLQNWLVKQDIQIAFNKQAIVYDQKTSHKDQLVKQRSRWINTWFKYFSYGFGLISQGIKNKSLNQFLFGLVLLRPPLFMFLLLSVMAIAINIILGLNYLVWLLGLLFFVLSFFLALAKSNTDKRIYSALIGIPKFMFYQVLSLTRIKSANKISVATKHQKTID
ncbi:glycosyltransferase [Pedobacter sp. SD-b]|uniref:Glycosyltransferase n=1 Tax=Pedobacter segetis TaxID=2793069 RepID=A0ABS1BLK6_9SPHI|nr:glycosyltransferase [Pedobacter segetis]MBK0383667.1 glycosyltransferase [Pedobacter segetis]